MTGLLSIVILLPFFTFVSLCIFLGLQTCDDSRFFTTELKARLETDLQCHWGVPQGSHSQFNGPFPAPAAPMVHHSILHHQAPPAGGQAYDTLSLESSDSLETSVSTGNNSTCSPERWERGDSGGALVIWKHSFGPKHLNLVAESSGIVFQVKNLKDILTILRSPLMTEHDPDHVFFINKEHCGWLRWNIQCFAKV